MKPLRDPAYLAFVRSLPCAIELCREHRRIEAHHTGLRGMSQKADDRTAIPLCPWHHTVGPTSVHHLGPREFARFHNLDIPALVARLNARPRIVLEAGLYVGILEQRAFTLGPQAMGLPRAIERMKDLRRECLYESEATDACS